MESSGLSMVKDVVLIMVSNSFQLLQKQGSNSVIDLLPDARGKAPFAS